MQKAKAEHDQRTPGRQAAHDHIFDAHIHDRGGDQRFHDVGGDADDVQRTECQRDRMSQREGSDLPEKGAEPEGEEKEAEHEKDVIQPLGDDVIKAHNCVIRESL